jgi:chromosomal replication initiator protein
MNSALNLEKVWKSALKAIKEDVPVSSFQAWIKPALLIDLEGNKATIEVRNEFSRNLLIQNYHRNISKGLQESLGQPVDLVIKVNSQMPAQDYIPSLSSINEPEAVPKAPVNNLPLLTTADHGLNPRYVFDNFIVGGHNQFCHAAALAIAERKAGNAYNPFFIYGDVGLGKTHIMQSIGNYMLGKNSGSRVIYLSAERFLNDLIACMRKSKMNEFRARYRSVDLLLIDDIQFIEGKETTQEEFFHTFNALKENGSQIVLTSDRPPHAIPRLEPRLCSRFEGGLIADVQAPTYETRLAILARKADELKMILRPEIADLVSRAFAENIRRLEGALVKLQAYTSFTNKPITLELTEHVLQIRKEDFVGASELAPAVRSLNGKAFKDILGLIIELVSARIGISGNQIVSRDSTQEVKNARQVCMTVARSVGLSLSEISQGFDGRGNSAILNSIKRVQTDAKSDPQLSNMLDEIIAEVKRESGN